MPSVCINLPDGSQKNFDHNPTVLEVAESIGQRLAQDTLGGLVEGELLDLRASLKDGSQLEIVTPKHEKALEVLRHSGAHIMAQAVQELWPEIKVTIGPVIENGFFYDFDSERTFTPEDLDQIEVQMKDIVSRKLPIVKELWKKEDAIKVFKDMGERFKVEIIEDLDEPEVGIYKQGDWFDLCRGPHIQNTGQLKAFKVLSTAGAYWRGDEKNPQLQRIYATAFTDKKELKQYLNQLEEAKKRDHRKLGKDLGLFYFNPLSPGGPFFTDKGAIIYRELSDYIRKLYFKYGYNEVISPQVFDVELYHQSGHYDNFKENMYFTTAEGEPREMALKPMNCPGHCVLFGSEKRSYRDLPYRMADFGRLHRYERSGVLHGLTRVRTMCQDDAHIFCAQKDLQKEVKAFVELLQEVYSTLGLNDYKVYLATRPEKRVGSDQTWDESEEALAGGLKELGIDFSISPGEGAFYGPKVEFHVVDAIGRSWQLGTIQLDFNMPERFNLKYTGDDNTEHTPIMLHRAILGSMERFIGVYLEHSSGRLPTWLSPVQVKILNITDRQLDYGSSLKETLKSHQVRVHFDDRSEKLGFKIREAQLSKVPYMVILGDKEMEQGTVSLRLHGGVQKEGLKKDDFIKLLLEDIQNKQLTSPLIGEKS